MKYKEMCKSAEAHAINEAILLVNIRMVSKELEPAKLNHQTYAQTVDCEVSRLKEERQLVKVE